MTAFQYFTLTQPYEETVEVVYSCENEELKNEENKCHYNENHEETQKKGVDLRRDFFQKELCFHYR